MKSFFKFLSLVLMTVLMMPSCSSDGLVEDSTSSSKSNSLIAELQEFNTNYSNKSLTRGNRGEQTVSDDTYEVVKADLIGAFEGACKGFEYAVDKGLAEDEAVAVIVASAVVHGAARSHQAYMSYHAEIMYPITMAVESENNFGSDAQLNDLKEDVVTLAGSNGVRSSKWMRMDNELFAKIYPNALYVAKLHNAILSNINFAKDEDYISNLQNYSNIEREYLTSDYVTNSFRSIIRSPFQFSQYENDQIHSSDRTSVMCLFYEAITNNVVNINDYLQISRKYIASITSSSELTYYDKECLSMGIAVGLYSMEFWTSERTVR